MPAWLIPAITAVGAIGSALLGKKSADKAADAQNAAIAAQQGAEAQKMALIQDQMKLADRFLYGGEYTYDTGIPQPEPAGTPGYAPTAPQGMGQAGRWIPGQVPQPNLAMQAARPGGVTSSPTVQGRGKITGAVPQAEDWTQNLFNWLRTSPDITFNTQKGQLESNIKRSLNQAGRYAGAAMGTQSGPLARAMGNIAYQKAQMLGQLEGQRHDRRGERLSAGAQLAQTLLDRALNMRSAATGAQLGFQSQIPQMTAAKAGNYLDQSAGWGNLGGSLLNTLLMSQLGRGSTPSVPTAAAPAVRATSANPAGLIQQYQQKISAPPFIPVGPMLPSYTGRTF